MTRSQWIILLVSGISAGSAAVGCAPGGVGDPCVPEDEYTPTFSGFGEQEANVESRSFQCETRVCIVNHFRGRVSCPYGQVNDPDPTKAARDAAHGRCHVPASPDLVTATVAAQLTSRRADSTVYCSCRCKGTDTTAKYCTCPSGYSCSPLVPDLGLGKANLAGSYCLKNGSDYTGNAGQKDCTSNNNICDTAGYPANKNPGN